MARRLLLISNSTNYGEEYLAYTKPYIKNFLGDNVKEVLFIPYAGITMSYEEYLSKVNSVFMGLGYEAKSIHDEEDKISAIENSQAIVVGGGNTFHLTYMLHETKIINAIRNKVEEGTPYLGWSAGSNIACPTLISTNDMPIIKPESFETLNLVPFQINPHYTDTIIPNHSGESREKRIKELLAVNPSYKVVGLKEGTMLSIENDNIKLLGNKTVKIFQADKPVLEYDNTKSLDFLLK